MFNREQLIEELKRLSAECVDDKANIGAILFVLQEVVILKDFAGLSSELSATKAGDFLDRALEKKSNTRTRIEKEQSDKKIKNQKNAQKNIWAAIKRKDMSAIPHLLSKNLDLNEIGSEDICLSEYLKKITHDYSDKPI